MSGKAFSNFAEFWHYTKTLSMSQRDILLGAMPANERKRLKKSYQDEGWEDLFIRNFLDSQLDFIKEKLGVDIIYIRIKVLDGESDQIPRKKWKQIYETFFRFGPHAYYILGDLKAELIDKDTISLSENDRDDDM